MKTIESFPGVLEKVQSPVEKALAQQVLRALRSNCHALILTGAPGAGKTRIARGLLSDLSNRGLCPAHLELADGTCTGPEQRYWSNTLLAWDVQHPSTASANVLYPAVLAFCRDRARSAALGKLVMLVDDAQYLPDTGFRCIARLRTDLIRAKVRPLLLLVGGSSDGLISDQIKRACGGHGHRQWKIELINVAGLRSVDDLQSYLASVAEYGARECDAQTSIDWHSIERKSSDIARLIWIAYQQTVGGFEGDASISLGVISSILNLALVSPRLPDDDQWNELVQAYSRMHIGQDQPAYSLPATTA